MPHRSVAVLGSQIVGRYHGAFATHVAILVRGNGRVECRGWGLRVDAEAALERALSIEAGLRYAAVHTTEPDKDSGYPLTRRLDDAAVRRLRGDASSPSDPSLDPPAIRPRSAGRPGHTG